MEKNSQLLGQAQFGWVGQVMANKNNGKDGEDKKTILHM